MVCMWVAPDSRGSEWASPRSADAAAASVGTDQLLASDRLLAETTMSGLNLGSFSLSMDDWAA